MLEIRPFCENCGKSLPPESKDAFICSFECTFCKDCVQNVLEEICPNCGGNFEVRPIRPKSKLITYPPASKPIVNPVDLTSHQKRIEKFKNINPENR